jgi:acetolactate synthase-1/2/3 large subunit
MLCGWLCVSPPNKSYGTSLDDLVEEKILQFAEALFLNGVRGLFGVAGSGLSWQLITAMEERGVPFFDVSHEAAGAIMAGAFGRQGGSFGAAISIKGPGLANLIPGIVSNHFEQWPTLTISESYDPNAPLVRMHKRVDHRALLFPVIKAYATLAEPAVTTKQLENEARNEIPGPVHLDLLIGETQTFSRYKEGTSGGSSSQISSDKFEKLLARSQKPVLIVGSLARRSSWAATLTALELPIFTTLAAKGVIDEWSPWAAGIFTGDGKELSLEKQIIPQADLVVGLALRNLEVLTPHRFPVPLISLDVVGPETTWGFEADETLVSSNLFDSTLENLKTKAWKCNPVTGAISVIRQSLTVQEWSPGRIFLELEKLLPSVNCLVVDTGLFCTVAEHVWRARAPNSFLASANGRFMGTSIPMAIGAALARPKAPAICAVGDGGIRPYVAEFKLAIEHKLPILFLLMTDGRYGSIAAAPSAPNLSLSAVTIARPSWFEAIEALGCEAAQIDELDKLISRVRNWKFENGPLFLETVFAPTDYAQMISGVR